MTDFHSKRNSDQGDTLTRKAKRSSTANLDGSGLLGFVFGRPAFATRVVAGAGDGIGAPSPSHRSSLRLALVSMTVSTAAILMFFAGPASASECPNEAIRLEQGAEVLALPDCMALEQVSPPQKSDQPAKGVVISADGDRVRFQSVAPLGETPGVHVALGDRYVAGREASGWVTKPTVPPITDLTEGWEGEPFSLSFTPELSSWFVLAGSSQQATQGIGQAFSGALSGFFAPISPLLTPSSGGEEKNLAGSKFLGASQDHSNLYFSPGSANSEASTVGYLLGDPKPSNAPDPNVYIAHLDSNGEPSLELLARDREGKAWGGNCGTRLGGIGTISFEPAPSGERGQGAISANGSRVYFSARSSQSASGNCEPATNKLRILQRIETSQGPWIGQLFSSECTRISPACKTTEAEGDDLYQGASADGIKVYFTTNRQLANSDLDGTNTECSLTSAVPGCDLYLYDSAAAPEHRLTQVSAGEVTPGHPIVGSGANVINGITAISSDGSHVYFVAEGVLTGENAEHKSPSMTAGARNLYLYESDAAHPSGHLTYVATLSSGDSGKLWGEGVGAGHSEGGGTWHNQAYPVPISGSDAEGTQAGGDGHILLFESQAELTPNDTDGNHTDVYRYDAETEELQCVSCRPAGLDAEPFDVGGRGEAQPPGTDFAEEGRWVSEDGNTVVFKTTESLIPTDTNNVANYYAWTHGELFRLPGKAYNPPPAFTGNLGGDTLTVSADGSEIGFVSSVKLLPSDGDAVADVYVARADGGYQTPSSAPPCQGEGCQEPFIAQPDAQSGEGTESSIPGGNIPLLSKCKHGYARKKGKCVKKKSAHRGKSTHRGAHQRAANQIRRNGK